MAINLPLALTDQVALERATHAVLDPHKAKGWRVSLIPFLTMPGCMLEVAVGRDYVERRLLDVASPDELVRALRQVVRRRVLEPGV